MDNEITELGPLTTEYAETIASWLQGPQGRETLRLLGNVLPPDFTTDTEQEYARIKEILANSSKIGWIILFDDEPVGVAEVDLKATDEIQAPHISYFIGDVSNRGNGIGTSALGLMLDQLKSKGYKEVFGRTIDDNVVSEKVMLKMGFTKQGPQYTDKDNLIWQNYRIAL